MDPDRQRPGIIIYISHIINKELAKFSADFWKKRPFDHPSHEGVFATH